ncbi:Uncharacterised protein [Mycobacterium tuberculosis]|nr:Uncharacterised protein [Mycobacterium tuberculosis]COY91892.1 Uncharacterised protein [Mycobacterium tuberculosis]
MRAAGNTFRQCKLAYRAIAGARRVENQAIRCVVVHVGGEGDQIAVVLGAAAHPWSHRGLTSVDAVTERVTLVVAGEQIVLNQSVEQEPTRFAGSGIGVTVAAGRVIGVDGSELGDGLGQLLLVDCPGHHIEPPPM